MFHTLCGDVEILFDNEAKAIIEEKYAILYYMRKTERRRLAMFTDECAWEASSYRQQASDYIANMAMWFWIDIEQTPESLTKTL